MVHDSDLVFDGVLVERIRSVDELGDEVASRRLLDGSVHHAESAAAVRREKKRDYEIFTLDPMSETDSSILLPVLFR